MAYSTSGGFSGNIGTYGTYGSVFQPVPKPYVYYDPIRIYTGGTGGTGGTTGTTGGATGGTATATSGPTAPASPTASASDLQVMIASIPVAQDGFVITADYHNALRLALVAIANRLGLGTVSEEITVTNAPRLLREGNNPEWEHQYGIVRRLAAAAPSPPVTHGWMEVELPDGARLKRMTAFATRGGTAGTLKLKLRRQKITDASVTLDLITVDVPKDADLTRGIDADITVPGAGPAALEEYRIVNNREHKYLLLAELDAIDASTTAQITAFQIVCGQ